MDPSVAKACGVVVVDLQNRSQFGFCVLQPTGESKTAGVMVAVQKIQRISLKPPLHRFDGVDGPADGQQVMIPIPEENVA